MTWCNFVPESGIMTVVSWHGSYPGFSPEKQEAADSPGDLQCCPQLRLCCLEVLASFTQPTPGGAAGQYRGRYRQRPRRHRSQPRRDEGGASVFWDVQAGESSGESGELSGELGSSALLRDLIPLPPHVTSHLKEKGMFKQSFSFQEVDTNF